MTNTQGRVPTAAHPIDIARTDSRVIVTVGGEVIADTLDALTLRESNYASVVYVPRKDVKMELLQRTKHQTHCPYKGDASYYSIPLGGQRATNAIWTYETPYAAVAAIKDYLAFYPDRVDSITIQTA